MAGPPIATFAAAEFNAGELADAKQECGEVVSFCLPARDEAGTIGPIVESVRSTLMGRVALVDEVLVIDDHSCDATAVAAADAGARVVPAASVLSELAPGPGKGEAMWKSLFVAKGDLVVWCDADIYAFDPQFVVGLLGPLLSRPEVGFVKGFYERPADGLMDGGRVTELVARPAICLLFPELASVVQPLAGEYAGRRSLLETLPFVTGYGVDLGLLLDAHQRSGPGALAQVDLGVRRHRHRSLDELGPQALAVLHAVLCRAGVVRRAEVELIRPDRPGTLVGTGERPPLLEVPAYRDRLA